MEWEHEEFARATGKDRSSHYERGDDGEDSTHGRQCCESALEGSSWIANIFALMRGQVDTPQELLYNSMCHNSNLFGKTGVYRFIYLLFLQHKHLPCYDTIKPMRYNVQRLSSLSTFPKIRLRPPYNLKATF